MAALEPETFKVLVALLGGMPPSLRQGRYVGAVRAELAKQVGVGTGSLVPAILSVAAGREESSNEPAEFARRVAFSKDLKIERVQREVLKDRLIELLGIPSVVVTAKSWDLLLENEHNFRSARVLTDLRPIFVDGHSVPQAALVLHQLRITHGTKHLDQDIIITMDDLDLLQLLQTLERAQRKAEQLRSALGPTEIRVLNQETP